VASARRLTVAVIVPSENGAIRATVRPSGSTTALRPVVVDRTRNRRFSIARKAAMT